MADSDVPGLSALTGANSATGDLVHVVDVSDTTFAADGTDKRITLAELAVGLITHGAIATDAEVAAHVAAADPHVGYVLESLLVAAGDVLYASGVATPARLPVGTALQTLRTNAGATAPEWVSGGYQLVATSGTLAASATSINFSSIPATFKHLRVVASLRSDRAATFENVTCTMNNDTTDANYRQTHLRAYPSGVASTENVGASVGARRIAFCTGDSAAAGVIGRQIIDIPHYADAFFKVASSRSQVMSATSAGAYEIDLVDVWHITTAVIDRLTFAPEVGTNWIAGSRIDLYGSL